MGHPLHLHPNPCVGRHTLHPVALQNQHHPPSQTTKSHNPLRPPSPSPPRPATPPRHSTRSCRPPDRLGNWSKSADAKGQLDTPKTWNQLLKSPNKT
jgi:hypothetical protein